VQQIAEELRDAFLLGHAADRVVNAPEIAEWVGSDKVDVFGNVFDIYIALAEKKEEFRTGDEKRYNALHSPFSFVRWIADEQRKRPWP
jgi:hypothetical protein